MSTPDPRRTSSPAAALSLVLGAVGAVLAFNSSAVFVTLFLGLSALAAAPLGFGDRKELSPAPAKKALKQAAAGAALGAFALFMCVLVLTGATQRGLIEDSGTGVQPGQGGAVQPDAD